jgi:hypothetical protein
MRGSRNPNHAIHMAVIKSSPGPRHIYDRDFVLGFGRRMCEDIGGGRQLVLRRQAGFVQSVHQVVSVLVSNVDDSASPLTEAEVWP